MGVGQRRLAPLWALALTLACAQHTGQARNSAAELSFEHPDLPPAPQGPGGTALRGVTIHPPLRTAPVVRALNAAHGGRVCSTWGDFHYKTFDGDVFRFPGLCNYVFSAHCGSAYEDFNLQLRRGPGPNSAAPSRVTMKLDGLVVRLTKGSVLVNGRPIQLPFSQSGVLIEQSNSNLKVVAKLGLVLMWNQDDSLLLELDAKYTNQTCGLCGDFNGVPVYNEFFSHNVKLTPTEFGNLQKMDGPMEQCQDPVPEDAGTCQSDSGICEEMLSSEPFSGCARLVNTSSYLEACRHDLCHCSLVNLTSCLCHTLAEYSRQCAHAGGLPLDWRGPQLCPQTCPLNMRYHECGSPCAGTCSNPERSQLCEDHCVAGCFCPEGMVLDDISHAGCVPVSGCSCVYNGATYAPGTGYSTGCTNCTCSGGRWTCQEAPCPGTCSVLGGAHISTFDEKQYRVHGDCNYVLAKPCESSAFTVLAELRRCGLTDSETCLKSLTLSLGGGHTVFVVKASGEVFVNQIYTQLPVSAANVTLFRPSTFFIIAQTQLGLQLDIQLVPIMQVFVRLGPETRGQSCGLCGNFNQNQADDFRTISGLVEGSAAAFANTWKTQATCPNVKNSFEDPCSLSVENEKYAQRWCSQLTDPHGPFAQCHSAVDPSAYYSNCLFDTCNCEKSEDCMCAALSSYVRACAAWGVLLSGWRDGVCTKPMATCPKSLTYRYNISTCLPTCRARSDEDVTCSISFVPVDGCTCPDGTFLDDAGACVPATSCPCYFQGSVVPNGESRHEQGIVCSCTQGTLTCIGGHTPDPVCLPPMVYFDCRNATAGASGAGCQKSCDTLDMDCYSTKCEPGCVCPDGLVASGDGGCVPVSACPCVHNEASYQPGQTIRVGCNTCTCQSRAWQCTDQPCLATCAVYGDGHYLTFDGRRYSFSGDCEYTLLQDHCGGNGSAQDSFRVVTENVPCGTTGTTCSKAIKIFLGSYELKLSDGKLEVIETGPRPPYSIRQMGIYLVVDTEMGLVLLWDKGTSIFLRLSPEFKGRVCGLCGNFDDNALNDLTTRSQSVVGDVLEFGNSWKFSPSCPDALAPRDPCTANPFRRSWAQKQCSIINSATFSACHTHVEPSRYYEACVSDVCACDSGGDCECFCTAVAAYAQACHDAGVCVSWRTPDVCPLSCDHFSPQGRCQWHYQPCGAPCLRTCRNPRGQCRHDARGLEGCYPKCPAEAPIFDEDQMQCVASCPPPSPQPPCHVGGQSFWPNSTVPSDRDCYSCICTKGGVQCAYDANACICTYNGRRFHFGDVIYHTTDGLGSCISARCGANGTIERGVHTCSPTTPTPQTTFSFSTSLPASRPSEPSSPEPTTVTCLQVLCNWTEWIDGSYPGPGINSGDFDTISNLRAEGYKFCAEPKNVQCRAESFPDTPLQELGQDVICDKSVGLICRNKDQLPPICYNYNIRFLCCELVDTCRTNTTSPATPATTQTTTTEASATWTTGTLSTSTKLSTASSPHVTPPRWVTPSTHEQSSPGTTPCKPKCRWTKWFDGDFPMPGPHGGDNETFGNIMRNGDTICHRPESISKVECRAENHPGVSIHELGQLVQCHQDVGLLCRNQDQKGKTRLCLNYQIRVLCCEPREHCPPPTVTVTSTSSHNLGSYKCNLCADKQHNLSSYNELNPCAHKQRNLGSNNQYNLCAHKQRNLGSYNQYNLCAHKQRNLGSYNQYNLCAHKQRNLGSYNQYNLCAENQHHLGSYNQYNPCAEKQHHLGSYNELNACAHKQRNLGSNNQYNLCAHKQRNLGSYNELNPCAHKQRNLGSNNQYNLCADKQHHLGSYNELNPCAHKQRNLGSYNELNLCAEKQHHLGSYNQYNPCAHKKHNLGSNNQYNLCAHKQRNLGSYNQYNLCADKQRNLGSYNQYNLCADKQRNLSSYNQYNLCADKQRNLGSYNQYNLCADKQRNLGSYNQYNLCADKQHHLGSYNQYNLCADKQHHLGSYNQYNLCAHKQHHLGSYNQYNLCAHKQHHLGSYNQYNLCADKQRNLGSYNQYNLCADKQRNLGSNNQYNLCAHKQRNLGSNNQYNPCAHKQHHLGSYNQYNLCAHKQRNLGSNNQYNPCADKQRNLGSYNELNPCADKQHNLGSNNQYNPCAHKQRNLGSYNELNPCADKQHNLGSNNHTTSVQRSSTTSAPTTSTTSVSTSETTPSPRSTVPCFCNVSGQLYPAGSVIYRVTDLSGYCYHAFCSPDCQVVKETATTCPTSMPPPTPTTSLPESSTPTTVSVTQQGCPNAAPPRMKGETWPMPNCSEATCQGNGVITVSPRHCPKVQKPTCANGYPAVQVTDHDGCCPHYQCQCVCSGWGDPHYITFDGTYYTFLDNCTYVLLRQIVPVFGHFRVLVENYFCDAKDGLSCPQSIIVEYHDNRVMLTRKPVHGVMTNEIIFNGEVVRTGFQKGGIAVFQVGIKMYVSIPKLGVQVMFSGLIFSVEVPFSKFANNTEGQCGTCTNDQKDECRLPGGAVVASCSDMSGHWKVTYPGQPSCHGPPPTSGEPGTSPTPGEPGTSPTPCPPSPICQLILSKPFELCHVLIPPWPYYQGCTFDQCHMPGTDMVCTALELYAALCASLGVCVDWRGHTNSGCPFTCPAGMEYQPCGPPTPFYCYTNSSASPLALLKASPITEGCFCPQGTMLYSSSKEVCVPDCKVCLGPSGEPVEPGRTVSVDCYECTCEGSTRTMSCRPRACPTAPPCPASGQVPVPEAMQTGQCCPQYRCACDTRHCPEPEACPKGSHAVQTYKEAACCPTYNCSWTVCNINGTLYQPGAVVSSSLCEKCRCELPGGALSDTFLINCETQICSTSCPLGFKYQARAEQCCGECVQVACIINTSNSSAHLFYPGESWSDPGDHCVTHECEQHRDGLVVVTTKKACPPLTCPADKALPSEDGCCLSCPTYNRSTCAVHHQLQVLRQQGCSSPGPVRLAYCRGNCGDTTSVFSPEANAVERRCSCCRELRFSLRNVTLHCKDGSSRALTYTEAEECGCEGLHCDSPGGLGLSAVALEPSPESGLRRRVRRAPRARPVQ
ncbi:mucin-5AC isoform X3 [Bubalus bubalis]|uniref:mucin-5AC isoform X3 n=1 Tax=Bubalus bubalis TaxID=89462 RepID=UPI001E1B8497|nr:mucin-5AC isoform X3 [Bubalus bubalis]